MYVESSREGQGRLLQLIAVLIPMGTWNGSGEKLLDCGAIASDPRNMISPVSCNARLGHVVDHILPQVSESLHGYRLKSIFGR